MVGTCPNKKKLEKSSKTKSAKQCATLLDVCGTCFYEHTLNLLACSKVFSNLTKVYDRPKSNGLESQARPKRE